MEGADRNGDQRDNPVSVLSIIELDDGKIYRKALYLMVKTMVSCKFSLTNPVIPRFTIYSGSDSIHDRHTFPGGPPM